MNYLAHTLLSTSDPIQIMGNMWGDLLRPKDYDKLHPDLLLGIQRHKIIDAFTDQHPSVNVIVSLLRPFQGKYTPVVADVLMDYMLSKYWDRFQSTPLEVFCEQKYTLVQRYIDLIPDHLHYRIHRMVSHRWLESCKNKDRMQETLKMLSRRASFENEIPKAMEPYEIHEAIMDEMFLTFFEGLRQHINPQNEG